MGFTPGEVAQMMAWEFAEAEAGWRRAHEGEDKRDGAAEWDDHELRLAGVEGF